MYKRAEQPEAPPKITRDYNYRAPGYTKDDELNYQTLLNRYAANYEKIRRDSSLPLHQRTQQAAFARMLNDIQNNPSKHPITLSDFSRVSPYAPMLSSNGIQQGVDKRHTILTDLARLTMNSDFRDTVDEKADKYHKYRTPSSRALFGMMEGRKPGEALSGENLFHAAEAMDNGLLNKTLVGKALSWGMTRGVKPALNYMGQLFTSPSTASWQKAKEAGKALKTNLEDLEQGKNYSAYTMPLLTEQGKTDATSRANWQRAGGVTGYGVGAVGDWILMSKGMKALSRVAKKPWQAIKGMFGVKSPVLPPGTPTPSPVNSKLGLVGGGLVAASYAPDAYEVLVDYPSKHEFDAVDRQRRVGSYDKSFKELDEGGNPTSELLSAHPDIASQLARHNINPVTGRVNASAGSYDDAMNAWRSMRGSNINGLAPLFKYHDKLNKTNDALADKAITLNDMAGKLAKFEDKNGKLKDMNMRNEYRRRMRDFKRAAKDFQKLQGRPERIKDQNFEDMRKGRSLDYGRF